MNKTIGLLLMPLEYVTDGQRYGMIVERIQGKESFGRIIADHPERLEELAGMTADYAQQGDRLWNLFHAKDPKDHEWHYRGLADALRELEDTFAYQEFAKLINQVFE